MYYFYTILLYLIQPLIWLKLLWRSLKAPAYRRRWLERYALTNKSKAQQGILLHAVSVGETIAAIPLIKALQQHYPHLPITVTNMTPTGSERVLSLFGDQVQHCYLPYDLPGAMHRFIKQLSPKLVIIMETELWPNMIKEAAHQRIPIMVANARLSQRSANGYGKFAAFTKQLLQRITLVAAQHQEDGNRFLALGLPVEQLAVTGSLKFDIQLSHDLQQQAVQLRQQWAPHRPVWIAASTHPGEDEIILLTHQRLLKKYPNLLLILVPRHPERFTRVTRLAEQANFNVITKSQETLPNESIQVIIGDTMGELMLLYGVSDLAFIGGSLIDHGGHNPLEAAAHAIPILMGSSIYNFQDICHKLKHNGGMLSITDSESLMQHIDNLLQDRQYRHQVGQYAQQTLQQNQGALAKQLALIDQLLIKNQHK